MAGNLKAFENLSENKDRSLSSQEQADLRKISPNEIKSQKENIGEKTFTIDGKSMKLKDIVSKLDFDVEGNRAKIKIDNKKSISIGWPSELGAAIQVYAIACNKSIGNTGIDGKVGKNTVDGLQSAQNAIKTEKKEKAPETGDKIDMNQIQTHNFTPEFNALGKTQKFQKMTLMNEYGFLNYQPYAQSLRKTKGDGRITYVSQIDGKTKTIDLKITRDINNKVDAMALARQISDAVTKAENSLDISTKNTSVEKGINSFDESKISNNLIRKWVELQDINFSATSHNTGFIEVKDKGGKSLGGLLKSKGFTIKNTDVVSNGNFDAKKFEKILSQKCLNEAIKVVKADVNKHIDFIPNDYSLPSYYSKINYCNNLIKTINSYDQPNSFKSEITKLNKIKKEFENKDKYINAKNKVNYAISKINKLGNNNENFIKNFDEILTRIKSIVVVEKDSTVKYKYKINYNTKTRIKFANAGEKEEYNEMIDGVVKTRRGVKQLGDNLFTIDVVGR